MIYLIDYENTGDKIFENMNLLNKNDKLIIFFSEPSSKMSFATHIVLENSKIEREYINVKVGGKNALDFQLSTYVGYLISEDATREYCIISKDAGFDAVCRFWKERNIKIKRQAEFLQKGGSAKAEKVKASGGTDKDSSDSLIELQKSYKKDAQTVLTIVAQNTSKQAINNALVKTYGSDKAGKIYKVIKPYIKNKSGK